MSTETKELIWAATTVVPVVVGLVTLLLLGRELWSKLRAARVEADVRLYTLFASLMEVAEGRGPAIVSERAVEYLLNNSRMADGSNLTPAAIATLIQNATIISPVGAASQNAATVAIDELSQRHEQLRKAGRAAMEFLATHVRHQTAVELFQSRKSKK